MNGLEAAKSLLFLGEDLSRGSAAQENNERRAIAYALVDIAETLREIASGVGHVADRTGR